MEIAIRRYKPEDVPRIIELHIQAIKSVPKLIVHDGPLIKDLYNIDTEYINNDGDFLVAECKGMIIGMGAVRRKDTNCGEIKRMRVDPKYWRNGIGQMILTRLEEIAIIKGYKRLFLDTSIFQLSAQKLYEKNNYKEIRREVIHGYECIIFEKDISR
jgi:N-acetylglutamate synthase-like GNAT family acetyltransferase